jgi:hypothetical protein
MTQKEGKQDNKHMDTVGWRSQTAVDSSKTSCAAGFLRQQKAGKQDNKHMDTVGWRSQSAVDSSMTSCATG